MQSVGHEWKLHESGVPCHWVLGQRPGTQKESTPMNIKNVAVALVTLIAASAAQAQQAVQWRVGHLAGPCLRSLAMRISKTRMTGAVAAVAVAGSASATIVSHESYGAFFAAAPSNLIREDWSSVPLGVIEGQIINGVQYAHTSAFGHQLAIGTGGWGFRLGVVTPTGVSNFSWSDRVTFSFGVSGISAFGIMFAQGNYTDTGTSVFAVQVDSGPTFYRSVQVVSAGPNVGYLGLTGLESAGSVTIWRAQSGANVVWSAYHIDYAFVPAPGALALLGGAGLVGTRRRR